MFSKACEYGLRSLIFIAMKSNEDQRVNLIAISEQIDSPVAFTAKILQKLAKGNIINSVKGPNGGFEIQKNKIATTSLAEIVAIIDGGAIFEGCGLGLKECTEEKPCPLHFKFKKVRSDLKVMLENTVLEEFLLDLENGSTYLKL